MLDSANTISVIVPLLNERHQLPELYTHLRQFSFAEIIWVDGGSSDGSYEWLQQHLLETDSLIQSESGRARQMNAGANSAMHMHLLFLHADTHLPSEAITEIENGLQSFVWGRFNLQFIESDWRMRVIAFFINWRSRLTGIATGDQAFFIRSDIFEEVGGFPLQPLMEDIELSQRLKAYGRPYCSRSKVATSARRWLTNGVWRTVLLMWRFRLWYFFGVPADKLAKQYRQVR